jgi:hypothetical protein
VEMLNAYADSGFKGAYPLKSSTQSCRSCHDKGSVLENTRGMSDCGGCHFTPKKDHPKI